ncbi:hypothetical protein KDH_72780 [Dictyobacter sp. S3.2.2.5]|uniref:Uncharacterized protein n=2 Tax=Dictyobacter halimunensis TaxID=3026934 RepID=A0ABQ6G1R4_9CHLR|nr:hypothetical protein KDH_72780 [Dictyobacter sp. S3.2.2.5]
MGEAATYEEAQARVEELTQRIRELDAIMEQKIDQMLDQESLWGTWAVLNRREALVREQQKLINQWNAAINDLLRFLPGSAPERYIRPSVAGF